MSSRRPTASACKGVCTATLRSAIRRVLIVSAMGVPQRFYADFAEWLASQGHAVMSFDYRGVGESRPAAHASRCAA